MVDSSDGMFTRNSAQNLQRKVKQRFSHQKANVHNQLSGRKETIINQAAILNKEKKLCTGFRRGAPLVKLLLLPLLLHSLKR
jgi:hypothetical protein